MKESSYGYFHTMLALGLAGVWTHAWSVPGSVVLVRSSICYRSKSDITHLSLFFPPFTKPERPSWRPFPSFTCRLLSDYIHNFWRVLLLPALPATLPPHHAFISYSARCCSSINRLIWVDLKRQIPRVLFRSLEEATGHESDWVGPMERDERRVWSGWG